MRQNADDIDDFDPRVVERTLAVEEGLRDYVHSDSTIDDWMTRHPSKAIARAPRLSFRLRRAKERDIHPAFSGLWGERQVVAV